MEIDKNTEIDNMEIDSVCSAMSDISIVGHLNIKLINDLNLLIREIAKRKSFDIDIYDVCVSCGNDIVWNQEYIITNDDSEWLRNKGKNFFIDTLNSLLPIENETNYIKAIILYSQICNLFLQSI